MQLQTFHFQILPVMLVLIICLQNLLEKFIRPSEMSISDYINRFERLYQKAKSYKMEIHDGVLAYHLLNSANLSDHHKQLKQHLKQKFFS